MFNQPYPNYPYPQGARHSSQSHIYGTQYQHQPQPHISPPTTALQHPQPQVQYQQAQYVRQSMSGPPPIVAPQSYYNMPGASGSVPPSMVPPPSPSSKSEEERTDEEKRRRPGPIPFTTTHDGKIWALEVRQQPEKARMCGFGDKDRRPINPPPCIRLIIMDQQTEKEIDYKNVDHTHFILTVDLWDEEGKKETNLVNSTSNAPSISSVTTTSYPQTVAPGTPLSPATPSDHRRIPAYSGQHFAASPSPAPQSSQMAPAYFPNPGGSDPALYARQTGSYSRSGSMSYAPFPVPPNTVNGYPHMPRQAPSTTDGTVTPTESIMGDAVSKKTAYSRNLIGSLCSSAFMLNDNHDVDGIWFVLHDLSVRTEGWFRLKMNFVNIAGAVESAGGVDSSPALASHAPVLASIFSAPFKVWTAKRFPGVGKATPLSRVFAKQGMKIPIRKENDPGKKRKANANGSDGTEEDEDEEDVE